MVIKALNVQSSNWLNFLERSRFELPKLWQYRLWSFNIEDTKLDIDFCTKNERIYLSKCNARNPTNFGLIFKIDIPIQT